MTILTRPILVLISSLILLTGCATSQKTHAILLVDESLMQGDQGVTEAWLLYGGARASWIDKRFFEKFPDQKSYRYSFFEELEAREGLVEYWNLIKEKNSSLHDAYIDQLVDIHKNGYLAEYVWVYFHPSQWLEKPEGLRLFEFIQWQQKNHPGHVAQTRVTVKIKDSSLPQKVPYPGGRLYTFEIFKGPKGMVAPDQFQVGIGADQRQILDSAIDLVIAGQNQEAEGLIDSIVSFFQSQMNDRDVTYVSVATSSELESFKKENSIQKQVVWIDWSYQRALYVKAFLKSDANQLPDALLFLEQEIKIAPYASDPHIERGYIMNRLKLPQRALQSYEIALNLSRKYKTQNIQKPPLCVVWEPA